MKVAFSRVALFFPIGATVLLMAGCTQEISSDRLAKRIGKPSDINFFGDQAVYMGDRDGYRYVHVRDLFEPLGFLGERNYMVPDSQWPMKNPMKLTRDASKWRDVTWLDGDAPEGVAQNVFLRISPTYPEGAPATMPASMPTTSSYGQLPTSEPMPMLTTNPATSPTTQPAASQP